MSSSFDFIPGTKDYRQGLKKHATKHYAYRRLDKITHLAVHHSQTKTGSAESFARYHVNNKKWPGIGYHFVIEKDGTLKWCHNLEVKSYHVGKSNSFSIGICVLGDFREQTLEEVQFKPLLFLLKYLKRELSIPNENVWGHSEFPGYDWKACPSIDMNAIRIQLTDQPSHSDVPVGESSNLIGPVAPINRWSVLLNPNQLITHPGESVIDAAHRINVADIGAIKERNKTADLKIKKKTPQLIKVKGPVETLSPKVRNLIDTLKSKQYAVFTNDSKPFNINIVGIRNANPNPNRFDDHICVFWKHENKWTLKKYKATTDPGLTYLNDPINDDGTAILKEGQYRGTYKLGFHKQKYEALVQAKEVTVIRDFDRDSQLDFDSGKEQTGFYGINIHHASYTSESTYVNSWSAGCQVFAGINDYKEFISFCKQAREHWGAYFTYTLIKQSDLRLS